jgi:3-isopropylmalate/(R)-2-methylmalate dehydratase small subunit
MIAISTITSTAVPLPLPNIDTDQIIPKQFLKRIERTGYGEFLFFDWRYDLETPDHVEERKDFGLRKRTSAAAAPGNTRRGR